MSNRARILTSLIFGLVATVSPATAQSLSWIATYDGGPTLGQSNAVGPHKIVVDAQDNTYVAGMVNAGTAPEPLAGSASVNGLIVKYGPSGQVTWIRRIDDQIMSLVLDEQQQLLVLTAGASLKYTTSGNLLWRTPHLLGGRYVSPAAAALAPGGGIYLAGSTPDNSTGYLDVALARLDGLGQPVWLSTWNGLPSLDDEAQSIGVDTTGRIYVAGRSRKQESPVVDAYVTAAFDANGVLLWSRLLTAPDYTVPAAFAVDPSGGAVVSTPVGEGFRDWRSVKYDAGGGISWSRDFSDLLDAEFGTPDFAAVTPDGAVYVAGHSDKFSSGHPDLVRYSASGVQEWASVESATVLGDLPGHALAVDAAGRAIVVRTLASGQIRTSAYDASGVKVWSKDLTWTVGNPPTAASVFAAGVAVGPAGVVRIASTRVANAIGALLTVGYDGAGSFQWGVEPPVVAPDEGAIAVRFDGPGNALILATGFADGQQLSRTLKYDPSGALLWAKAFPGRPAALTVTSAGEAIAAGRADAPGGQQLAVVKYDAAGVEVWTRTYLPPGLSGLYGTVAVAVDATGNVYLAGRASSTDVRAVVVKYAPDGTFLWVKVGAYPVADLGPVGPFLALSPNGNVIVGGSAYQTEQGQYHVWALDAAGNTLWNVVGDAPGPSGGNVGALAVDAFGNVIVGDFYRGRVDKLSPSGVRLWSLVSADRVIALSVDPAGAIAVASGAPYAFQIAKYSSGGDELWSRSFEVGEAFSAWAWALRSSADGTVYAAGSYWDAALGPLKSGFIAAYDANGQLRWARAHLGVAKGPASFNALDVDARGRLVAAGYTSNGATNFDVLVESITDDPAHPLSFHTVSPCRVFDSRDAALGGPSAVPGNAPYEAEVGGRCGVPTTARSVALNLTVTGATDAGHVTLFPVGRVPPPTSTINHPVGITRATQAVVGLGDGGRVAVRAIQGSGSVHVILDVSGYFE
jgi:hypothetical protein